MYQRAETAQLYYSTDNENIMRKMTYMQRQLPGLKNIHFHKITDSFFQNGVNEHVLYLMGNGLTATKEGEFTADVKRMIDRNIDFKLIQGGINAFVDGVAWGYPRINGTGASRQGELFFFRVTEFAPIYDEITGRLMAGIRWTQIADDKPQIIELFEMDGITRYRNLDGTMEIIQPKTAYRVTATTYGTGERIINGAENYPVLPIFPLWANMAHTTELSTSIQALIDALDFVTSAQVDDVTLIEGVYWILQNYGGQNNNEIIEFITQSKMLKAYDDARTGAASHVLESPFRGKESLRNELNAKLYDTFRLPSPTDSRQVTATEIKAMNAPMDRKADLFEPFVREFMGNILNLYGIGEEMPDFKRRTLTNDSEAIANIATQKTNGWIDTEEAIFLDPTIPEDRKESLLERMRLEETGIPPDDTEVDDDESEDAEDETLE